MLDTISKLRPPASIPLANAFGPLALLRVLATNPLEAWTEAHFNEPIVLGGLPSRAWARFSDSVCAFALQEACIIVTTLMRHLSLELMPGHRGAPVQKVTVRPQKGLR